MNSFHSLASQVCQSFAMQNTVFKPHGKKAYARVILVGPSGLEPPTSCLSGTRSNLLSYDPMWYLAEVVLITWLTLWWRWWGIPAVLLRKPARVASNAEPVGSSSIHLLHNGVKRPRRSPSTPWWRWWDSNPWPPACRAGALPAELHPHFF